MLWVIPCVVCCTVYIGLRCVSWAALCTVGCPVYLGLGRARASGVANATCSPPPITSGHRSGAPNLRSPPSSGWPLHMSSLSNESFLSGFCPHLASYSCLLPLCVTPKPPHHPFDQPFAPWWCVYRRSQPMLHGHIH